MARFDSGVGWYTICNLDINVSFPEDQVMCKWCPFLVHYDSLSRDKCSITNEIIYSREFVGQKCPMTILNTTKVEDMKA